LSLRAFSADATSIAITIRRTGSTGDKFVIYTQEMAPSEVPDTIAISIFPDCTGAGRVKKA
jgi:hypothetical protein